MSVINAVPLLAAAGGDYQISRSVRLRSSASAYFSKTFSASPTSRNKFTFSCWAKLTRSGGSGYEHFITAYYDVNNTSYFRINASNQLEYTEVSGGAVSCQLITNAVYRDYSAWYHFMVVVDTTQATAANRNILYVNGQQVTSFATQTNFALNANVVTGYNTLHNIGQYAGGGAYTFDGYLTEVNFIDGQALTPSSFGETDAITGVWKPKKYAGSYGTNGFYLNFSDNSNNTAATIGKDSSGNGNNWTPNNISVTSGVTYDSMLDVPTPYADGGNGRGNYAVLSPIDKYSSTIGTSEANLKLISTSGGSFQQLRNTIGMSSGKYYMEWVIVSLGAAGRTGAALIRHDSTLAGASTSTTTSWCYSSTGDAYANNVTTSLSTGAITTGTDVVMYAFDADTGKFWMGKNGTWANSGDPANGTNPIYSSLTSGPYFFGGWNYNTSDVVAVNFGQRPFAYTPPSGFKALNTQNLPEPTIKKGNQYFDVSTWTGTNSTGSRTITGLGFQPDLIWGKDRTSAFSHQIYDSVRGTGKSLISNSTAAEDTTNISGYISAFNSDGFTATVGSTDNWYWNKLNDAYVAWQWKESATAGFDIVTYTGNGSNRTIAHSLGVAPKMVVVKARNLPNSIARPWAVWHTALSSTEVIFLNDTAAKSTGATTYWNSTLPTSSVFSVGTEPVVNGATGTVGEYVAYLFSEVAGFSRFGSYTGNGSSDGPFVFTGFRPRFVMIKRTDSTGPWVIWDSAREPTNDGTTSILYPNLSDAEYAQAGGFDLLSNGFKLRASTNITDYNASGGTYIYAAFAENAFKVALAR